MKLNRKTTFDASAYEFYSDISKKKLIADDMYLVDDKIMTKDELLDYCKVSPKEIVDAYEEGEGDDEDENFNNSKLHRYNSQHIENKLMNKYSLEENELYKEMVLALQNKESVITNKEAQELFYDTYYPVALYVAGNNVAHRENAHDIASDVVTEYMNYVAKGNFNIESYTEHIKYTIGKFVKMQIISKYEAKAYGGKGGKYKAESLNSTNSGHRDGDKEQEAIEEVTGEENVNPTGGKVKNTSEIVKEINKTPAERFYDMLEKNKDLFYGKVGDASDEEIDELILNSFVEPKADVLIARAMANKFKGKWENKGLALVKEFKGYIFNILGTEFVDIADDYGDDELVDLLLQIVDGAKSRGYNVESADIEKEDDFANLTLEKLKKLFNEKKIDINKFRELKATLK